MRKGKDPDTDPYLWLIDTDPGGPETYESCGSGSPTLDAMMKFASRKGDPAGMLVSYYQD
jgi:hypothetical protein